MLDSRHVSRLVVLGRDDPSLVGVLPRLAEVDVLPIGVSQPPAERVKDGGPGTDVPLLDDRGVDVDVLVSSRNLPHLVARPPSRGHHAGRLELLRHLHHVALVGPGHHDPDGMIT